MAGAPGARPPRLEDTLRDLRSRIAFEAPLVEAAPAPAPLPTGLHPALREALLAAGVGALYRHQAEAFGHFHPATPPVAEPSGPATPRPPVLLVTTPTASGKSLCYWLPILQTLLADPERRAFALFPTKALAQNQLLRLEALLQGSEELRAQVRAGIYDGDTEGGRRKSVRETCNIVLTNPDMLHASILPAFGRWGAFFEGLSFIVVDEAHIYRGVFGSHVALVLARLRRLRARFGTEPLKFILTSATIGNPEEVARALTGSPPRRLRLEGDANRIRRAEEADPGREGRAGKTLWVWNPLEAKEGMTVTGSAMAQAAFLLAELAFRGHACLAFTGSRLACELLGRYLFERLEGYGAGYGSLAATYRSGYTPADRRSIEKGLVSGRLRAVVATSALELGIDIGSLDVVVQLGFPGSIAAFRQQAGRAGRQAQPSLVCLVPTRDPFDQYLLKNPRHLLESPPEEVFLDPGNRVLLGLHLPCAAFEYPLSAEDEAFFGPRFGEAVQGLLEAGRLRPLKERFYPKAGESPARSFGLRSLGETRYRLLDVEASERPIGEVDGPGLDRGFFPGGIHLAAGLAYEVMEIDAGNRQVYLRTVEASFYTVPDIASRLFFGEEVRSKPWSGRASGAEAPMPTALLAQVVQHAQVVRLICKEFHTHRRKGFRPAERALPPLETLAVRLALSAPGPKGRGRAEGAGSPDFLRKLGPLVGLRHLLELCLPMEILADRGDLQVVLDLHHPEGPGLALLDIFPGGMGLAQKAFDGLEGLLRRALAVLENDPCDSGCPACIGVEPFEPAPRMRIDPDKAGTRAALEAFLAAFA